MAVVGSIDAETSQSYIRSVWMPGGGHTHKVEATDEVDGYVKYAKVHGPQSEEDDDYGDFVEGAGGGGGNGDSYTAVYLFMSFKIPAFKTKANVRKSQ